MSNLQRREFLVQGSAALAGFATFMGSRVAYAFPVREGEQVIPWLDQPTENPDPVGIQNQLVWEELDSWITPNDEFFSISHFDRPVIDGATWSLNIDGLVRTPLQLTLDDIMARARQEVAFTVECSGNHGFPFFTGGIGNAMWAGTPLAPILEEAGPMPEGIEVVFFGTDQGETTVRDMTMPQEFARSMSLADAMNPQNILCYEMNGETLPEPNGFPLRLIAPGWYGIANVKWLKRIEIRNARYMSHMMARDYVTMREEDRDGETVLIETSVGRSLIKSAPARVTRLGSDHRIVGAAWGMPIEQVEVQIDDEPWQAAEMDHSEEAEHAWTFWFLDWADASPGEHTITSRAIGADGQVQPAMDDPLIARKLTYWESNGQIARRIAIT